MTIEQYLTEIEFAISKLMEAIWDDYEKAEGLKREIQALQGKVKSEYDRAIAMQQFAEDPDDLMAGVGRYWENYFGDDKELYHKDKNLNDLTKQLSTREFSINCLASDIIQHAKQGLSIVYGSTANWPKGRMIGKLGISEIINASRNQSLHYEEGTIKNANAKACFETLKNDQHAKFGDFEKRNLAFDIMQLLEWKDFHSFKTDMESIK